MPIKLGVVMDPIQTINFKKDSTLAILLEAQRRKWSIHYIEQKDLFLKDGVTWARIRLLQVHNNPQHWFDFGEERTIPLSDLNIVLMRKDPPFDVEYIFTTYLLETVEAKGTFKAVVK